MAIPVVNLSGTFNDWRLTTNSLATQQGDLASLTTTHKNTLTRALIEVDGLLNFSAVVQDTSPQLGGDLDINNFDITGTGNLNYTGSMTATSIGGAITGVTQSQGDNSTKLATTSYINGLPAVTKDYTIAVAVALGTYVDNDNSSTTTRG